MEAMDRHVVSVLLVGGYLMGSSTSQFLSSLLEWMLNPVGAVVMESSLCKSGDAATAATRLPADGSSVSDGVAPRFTQTCRRSSSVRFVGTPVLVGYPSIRSATLVRKGSLPASSELRFRR